jgi:type II secretory pathway pseudopilin PulG
VNQRGFSYMVVLAAVVIIGIVVEVARVSTWRLLLVDREAELLFRGKAYRAAVQGFYQSNGAYPRSLDDLLQDPRSPNKRYLRSRYADPMTKGEWMLVRAPDGGIAGVASGSRDEPLKRANFPVEFEKFSGTKSYSEWIFEYVPAPAAKASKPGAPPSTPASGPVPQKTF